MSVPSGLAQRLTSADIQGEYQSHDRTELQMWLRRRPLLSDGGERGDEVGLDVVEVLVAHRDAHHGRRHASGGLLLRGELLVRRRGRVDDERARVTDVGQVRRHAERVDELLAELELLRGE
eukprot:scaffold33245_cov61-Phaeocystis_antarctica.AAC.5